MAKSTRLVKLQGPMGKGMGEKRTKSKSPVTYQVIVRGKIPRKIRERLSTIHAQGILKARNAALSASKDLMTRGSG